MLKRGSRVCALTGAGISAESGIPTFRDAQTGYWSNFDPKELATPEGFRANPQRVWAWYASRRNMAHTVEPNDGHRGLARLENRTGEFTLVTQNVDSLHARAGSRNVLEIHGNILRARCASGCMQVHRDDHGELAESVFAADAAANTSDPEAITVPRCPRCGDYFRPDVVWFGEMLPEDALNEAFDAAARCEVFLLVGTSAEVEPAASLPVVAADAGAAVVEINPQATPVSSRAALSIRAGAGEAMSGIIAALG